VEAETVSIALGGFLIAAVSAILSYIVAKKYGDLAAVDATRKLYEEDAKRARLNALRSLINEVARIQKLAEHNSQLDPDQQSQPVARMPVSAFETAFVSGALVSRASQELLDAVADYLVCADSISPLVDIYVAGTPSGEGVSKQRMHAAVREIKEIWHGSSGLKKLVDKFNWPRSTFGADNPRLSRTGLEEPVLDCFLT